jgi:hypothetical protein
MLYSFYWVIFLPAYTTYEDGTEWAETSARNIQTQRNHPKNGYTLQGTRFRTFSLLRMLYSFFWVISLPAYITYDDGTDRVVRNVGT